MASNSVRTKRYERLYYSVLINTPKIFLIVSSILATFDIKKAVDANGKFIEPKVEYITSMIRCALVVRDGWVS